jgi:hypothetical protein
MLSLKQEIWSMIFCPGICLNFTQTGNQRFELACRQRQDFAINCKQDQTNIWKIYCTFLFDNKISTFILIFKIF